MPLSLSLSSPSSPSPTPSLQNARPHRHVSPCPLTAAAVFPPLSFSPPQLIPSPALSTAYANQQERAAAFGLVRAEVESLEAAANAVPCPVLAGKVHAANHHLAARHQAPHAAAAAAAAAAPALLPVPVPHCSPEAVARARQSCCRVAGMSIKLTRALSPTDPHQQTVRSPNC